MGKNIWILALALMASASSAAQPDSKPDANGVYRLVEQMPIFPGGDQGLMKYLATMEYPTIAREKDWEGTVYIEFIVDTDGSVTKARVIRTSGYGILDTVALQQIQGMTKWKPGMQDGEPVKVYYVVPIKFVLDGPSSPPPPPPPTTTPAERGRAGKKD